MIKNPFQQLRKENVTDKLDPNSELIEEMRILSKRIKKLESEVEFIKKTIQEVDILNKHHELDIRTEDTSPKDEIKQRGIQNSPTILYMSAPTADGVFSDFAEDIQIGKSIYVLVVETKERGTFSVIESKDAIATAIISTTQFLKPACKIVSSTNGIPNQIVTIEKGTAVFDGEFWKVEQKAIIKLEKKA